MSRKAGQRPDWVKPPAHLSKSTPVPAPATVEADAGAGREGLEPTRYGDWERKGIAVDF